MDGYGVKVDFDGVTLRAGGSNRATRTALNGPEGGHDVALTLDVIAGLDLKDAGRLTNGSLRVMARGGPTFQLHYLGKHAEEFSALHQQLADALSRHASHSRHGGYDFDIVGESHYRDTLLRLIKAAPSEERANGEVYGVASLEREPRNKFDRNAVRVSMGRQTVGYVPKEQAVEVRALIGDGLTLGAVIGWSSGSRDAPIGVRLAKPPARRESPRDEVAMAARVATPPAAVVPPTPVVPLAPVVPPAWYPDPLLQARLRYWDGTAWTEHVAT
jgi:hypothetical protein